MREGGPCHPFQRGKLRLTEGTRCTPGRRVNHARISAPISLSRDLTHQTSRQTEEGGLWFVNPTAPDIWDRGFFVVGAPLHVTGRSAEALAPPTPEASSTHPGQDLTIRMFPDVATRAWRAGLPRLNHCCGPRSVPAAVTASLESRSGPGGGKAKGHKCARVCVCFWALAGPGLSGEHRSLSRHTGPGPLGRTGL